MNHETYGYGLWGLVILNSAIFLIFAFSFYHPHTRRDYVGFLASVATLITLLMFPILVVVYVKLAHREEREVTAEFGQAYVRYASLTPGFIPRLRSLVHRTAS